MGNAKKFLFKHAFILALLLFLAAFAACLIASVASSLAALLGASGEEEYGERFNEEELVGAYPLDQEVLALKDQVLAELKKYGKEQYIYLYLAVIQQESGGQGEDIFQCSESLGKPPNSISRKESITQGVKYLSGMLTSAKVSDPLDLSRIKIALQAYNFGGGFIEFVKNNGDEWKQKLVFQYAYQKSGGVRNQPPKDEQLGMWKYGDQYYTQHVLRYYMVEDSTAGETGTVQGIELSKRMSWLFPIGTPTSPIVMEQYLTFVSVPVCDLKGEITYVNVRCHKKLANSIKKCFEEMAAIKFPVIYNGCYVWRAMSGSSSQSHHSYGVAIDINASANQQYTSGDKSSPYYITSEVVQIWKSQGFYWGGDWDVAHIDPMHFTYTNH